MLPRERLTSLGVHSLTDPELLALLLGTGTQTPKGPISVFDLANQLLARFGTLATTLNAPPLLLQSISGIGQAKACRLIAAGEISCRINTVAVPIQIKSAEDAFRVFSDLSMLFREELWIGLLNYQNQLFHKYQLSAGGIGSCAISPGEILRYAIKYDGVRILLAHNHPSGDPTPSEQDVRFTNVIFSAAQSVGIEMLDHIVVGSKNRYFSFAQEGFMPTSKVNSCDEKKPFVPSRDNPSHTVQSNEWHRLASKLSVHNH